jgi:hypothetical protein
MELDGIFLMVRETSWSVVLFTITDKTQDLLLSASLAGKLRGETSSKCH